MHAARIATGMAVLGTSVLAVAPTTSPPPAIATATSAVRLAAAPKPGELYPEVAQRTFFYAASLAQRYFSDPVPISRAVIHNQVAAVSNIITAAGSGDPADLLTALSEAVTQPIENAIAAGDVVVEFAPLLAGSAISPAVQFVASIEFALRDVVAAIASFDLIDLVNSVLDIPAHLANGVLNGGYPNLSPFSPLFAGILTPYGFMITVPGPVSTLTLLDQRVGQVISPESAVSPTPLPDPAPAAAQPDTAPPAGQGLDADEEAWPRVEADTAIEVDAEIAADTAGKTSPALVGGPAGEADSAAEARTESEAPAQRPARHGHRGDPAA